MISSASWGRPILSMWPVGTTVQARRRLPLDEDAIRAAVLARRDMVEAFAVSGYFSVRQ